MPAKVQIPEYFQEKAIFADSKEPGLKATSDKYMWVSRGGPPGQTSVLFEYDPSRKKKVPLRLLKTSVVTCKPMAIAAIMRCA